MKHWRGISAIILSLGLALALLPLPTTGALSTVVPTVTVSIDAPANVDPGGSFVADVAVDWVTDFDACSFDVTYDQTIITVTDVTGGEIDGHVVPVGPGDWSYMPPGAGDTGRIGVFAIMPGMPTAGVTGTGYIARIHFNVLGSEGNSSAIRLEGVGMYDYLGHGIATTTVDGSVNVVLAPPEITTTSPLPEAKVGDAYTATLAATGGKPPLTWGATGLPAGLTCSAGGVISGTPAAFGDLTITVTVADSASPPGTDSKPLALKVYPALEITTVSPLPEGKVGDAYTATLVATGGKTPRTWAATGLPAGLTCSTAGVISGTPTASGDFSVIATVTDSFSPPNVVNKVLSLKVYPALEITTASPLPEAKVGHAYSPVTLVAIGGKGPYTWMASGLPAGLTCSAAGVILGTPTASGDFTVTATVTDSFSPPGIVDKVLSLKVYPALEITTASPLPEGKVGDSYSATLEATGGKPSLSWEATGLPAGLTCSTAGVISGTPTASGDFSVTATVTDSFGPPGIVNKGLSLKVYPSLEITTATLADGEIGDAYTATLVATGGKAPHTWNATGLPAGLTCSTAGVISGTPTEAGNFTVAVTVTDSFSTPNIGSEDLPLTISCKLGDANTDGVVDTGDITKVKRIYFELDAPTPCADVNGDETVDAGDITAIKIIYFS